MSKGSFWRYKGNLICDKNGRLIRCSKCPCNILEWRITVFKIPTKTLDTDCTTEMMTSNAPIRFAKKGLWKKQSPADTGWYRSMFGQGPNKDLSNVKGLVDGSRDLVKISDGGIDANVTVRSIYDSYFILCEEVPPLEKDQIDPPIPGRKARVPYDVPYAIRVKGMFKFYTSMVDDKYKNVITYMENGSSIVEQGYAYQQGAGGWNISKNNPRNKNNESNLLIHVADHSDLTIEYPSVTDMEQEEIDAILNWGGLFDKSQPPITRHDEDKLYGGSYFANLFASLVQLELNQGLTWCNFKKMYNEATLTNGKFAPSSIPYGDDMPEGLKALLSITPITDVIFSVNALKKHHTWSFANAYNTIQARLNGISGFKATTIRYVNMDGSYDQHECEKTEIMGFYTPTDQGSADTYSRWMFHLGKKQTYTDLMTNEVYYEEEVPAYDDRTGEKSSVYLYVQVKFPGKSDCKSPNQDYSNVNIYCNVVDWNYWPFSKEITKPIPFTQQSLSFTYPVKHKEDEFFPGEIGQEGYGQLDEVNWGANVTIRFPFFWVFGKE